MADQRARGGGQGKSALYVLVASLILAAVAMMGYFAWSGPKMPAEPQQSSTPPGSPSSTSGVPPANPAYPAPRQ